MGILRPTNPVTGATIVPSSYTAAQNLQATLEARQGDNELIPLGLVAAPTGNRDLTQIAATAPINPRY